MGTHFNLTLVLLALALVACTDKREQNDPIAGDGDGDGDGGDGGDGDGGDDDAGDDDIGGDVDSSVGDSGPGDAGPFDLNCGSGFLCESVATISDDVRDLAMSEQFYGVFWAHGGTRDALGHHRRDGAIRRISPSDPITTELDGLGPVSELWILPSRIVWLEEGSSGNQSLFISELGTDDEDGGVVDRAPRLLRTGMFADFHVQDGVAAWRDGSVATGDPTVLFSWDLRGTPAPDPVMHTVESGGRLAGVALESDEQALYVTYGSTRITRVAGGVTSELLADQRAYEVMVGTQLLKFAHADADDRLWLASVQKTGGAVTHYFELEDNLSEIVSVGGSSWTINTSNDSRRWKLHAATPEENPQHVALDWLVSDNKRSMDVATPRWAADEWDAWALVGDQLVWVIIDED